MTWLEKKNPIIGLPNSWLVIALVFVLFFTGVGAGLRARYNLPSGQDVLGMEDTGDGWVADKYVKNSVTIDFEIDQSDKEAGGAVTPTSPVYSYFYDEPREGDTGVGITVGGEDITIKAENDGVIWIDAYGGSDFYLVDSFIRNSNPEVKATKITDWDGDDTLDYLIKMDLSRYLKDEAQFKQTYVMEMPLLDVDVTGLDDDDPADQTSIGTTQTTVTVTWKYTGVTAEDGYCISELYVLSNDTVKGNDILFKDMSISGTHTVVDNPSGVSIEPQHDSVGGAYAGYYIRTSDSDEPLDTENLILFRDTNMGDAIYFSVQIQCNFESGDVVTVDISFLLCSPDGTTATETDSVTLSA